MAWKTRLTPYDEENVDAFDLDESDSEFMSHRSTPSTAKRGDFLAEDSIPLFLSNFADDLEQPGFENGYNKAKTRPRIIKAGILAATVTAIGLALFSVENPLALFANAKASLIGVSAEQPSAGQTKSAAAPVPAERLASISPSSPTRDEIAAAFKSAHQVQTQVPTEIHQPPPAAPPVIAAPPAIAATPVIAAPPAIAAPPVRRIDADELAALLKRARNLIAIGDIAPARLLLERAADAQEASAALMLAQTYDPAVLGTPDMRSITPDPAMARAWYEKAAQLGSPDAQQRLAQMQN